jgi:5'-3' exonuclease
LEVTNADDWRLLFTGPDNFRFGIATEQPYKGNRVDFAKPYHWGTVNDYIFHKYGRKVVTCVGFEADDFMAFHRERDEPDKEYYICTRDKDLNTCPGYHYRWECGENQPEKLPYWITPFEAQEFFLTQCLMGDSTDNIPGCGRREHTWRGGLITANQEIAPDLVEEFRLSKKLTTKRDGTLHVKHGLFEVKELISMIEAGVFTAHKGIILEQRRKGVGPKAAVELLKEGQTIGDMLEIVRGAYKERFPEEDSEAILLENARLLHMGQRPTKLFDWTWLDGLLHIDNTDQYNKPEVQLKREFKESKE